MINSNSFLHHKASDDAAVAMSRLRAEAKMLAIAVDREAPPSREKAIAITKIEEALMWANKAIAMPRQENLLDRQEDLL